MSCRHLRMDLGRRCLDCFHVIPVTRSDNGSRIPNPFVDNAEPVNCRTWATVGAVPLLVVIKPMGSTLKTRGGALTMYVAQLEVDGSCAYGNGPGEAVKQLDILLSEGS